MRTQWYYQFPDYFSSWAGLNADQDPCTNWTVAIQCSPSGDVLAISPTIPAAATSGGGLRAALPSVLGLLTRLTSVQVLSAGGAQQLSQQQLPTELGRLTALQVLAAAGSPVAYPSVSLTNLAGDSAIGGTFPQELCGLARLQLLWIQSATLSGTLPPCFGASWPSLQALTLKGGSLSGTLPPYLGGLSSLQQLFLAGQFTGSVPVSLSYASLLTSLTLVGVLAAPLPPELFWLVNLSWLYLETGGAPSSLGAGAGGILPPGVGSLSALTSLYMHGSFSPFSYYPFLGSPVLGPALLGVISLLLSLRFIIARPPPSIIRRLVRLGALVHKRADGPHKPVAAA